ncbi:LLM class flavin-dependent oxidoreductase [Pullulanibacillus sp. KACC 23026]|uniref:LLM class flavin-dependent oxidoreductase n=1 Tax=Pullulanibacillus sp. KACC 23026 TaxID=3028315 RepID=UPI0023AFE3FF|nr:LLM class flavin-dependent oxidoreductase [Pullulanibacillus sp. KACC 23026]WEG14632.1 LLM class flavin-dependent oxidoreductase [Pullulanibacillus sp. KACC 23026]
MKLSILDQSPVYTGMSAEEALQASLNLAQLGEKYGYTRFWLTEHHDIDGLASTAPEVLLAFIGAQTSRIRLGSGAVLLPHYKPYKVAEVFHTLATLFPGRIDLGIGRAPGGSAEVTMALNDNFMQKVYEMPDRLEEVLHLIHNDFPEEHPYSKINALPLPNIPPEPWLLGTSKKSARLAARNGMAYAFGQFMSDEDGDNILQTYLNEFLPKGNMEKPMALITVNVVCSESAEEAKDIVLRQGLWQILRTYRSKPSFPTHNEYTNYRFNEKERSIVDSILNKTIYGTPEEVINVLTKLANQTSVSEVMISTYASSLEERIKSYQLIGQALK